MKSDSQTTTQMLVFLLVATGFTVVYITQPVLPVIEQEFVVDARTASLSVSMVIFGIALANLPFGMLVDRFSIKPIVLTGGAIIAIASLACALTRSFPLLIAARFVQGLFMPSLTTCIAAYLAQSLPATQLNSSWVPTSQQPWRVGWADGVWRFDHPPLHWRYAFVSAALLLTLTTLAAYVSLARENVKQKTAARQAGFVQLLTQPGLLRMFTVGFGAFSFPRRSITCHFIFPGRRLLRLLKSLP